ncbi:M13 family metallopeptidase [Cuniculiplasmataceae archaeon SKW1]
MKQLEKIREDERPEDSKFSIEYMDMRYNPMEDFYHFSNGKWLETHPIPSDKSQWGSFNQLRERNIYILGKIAEECALKADSRDFVEKIVGDFYISVMDTEEIERRKLEPVNFIMRKIDSINSKKDVLDVAQFLYSNGIPVLFGAFSMGDRKNSDYYAFYIYQGGLSMPNRDYYLLDAFSNVREKYIKHVEKMFSLYGLSEEEASKTANEIFTFEKKIAEASRPQHELRESEKNYNRFEKDQVEKEFKHINFIRFLELSQSPTVDYIIIGQPDVMSSLDRLIDDTELKVIKNYMKWAVLRTLAPFLHKEVEMENFDFFSRTLMGQMEPEKRWKKAVSIIDRMVGEALGQLYVKREFGPEARKRIETLVNDIREVFEERLKNLPWMSEKTKERALKKFKKFRPKIGFPSKWIDYSSVEIRPDDLVGNYLRSANFEFRRQIERIGKNVDRELWFMTPPTVNAYFSPTDNEIVFPAGILQPPFFDVNADDAVNYGAIGGVISHEITHGFDDQGRKYDDMGNLNDWWSEEDAENFRKRADHVVSLYSSYEILPGFKINGKLTLGENIADLGGVYIAFNALQRRLEKNPELRKRIDGLTPEQRFFISWAQVWKANTRDEESKRRITIDPHSPARFRGEIPPRNHEKFDEVFQEFANGKKNMLEKVFIW